MRLSPGSMKKESEGSDFTPAQKPLILIELIILTIMRQVLTSTIGFDYKVKKIHNKI